MSGRWFGLLILVFLYSSCGVTNPSGQGGNAQSGSDARAQSVDKVAEQAQVRNLISLFASLKRDDRESSQRALIELAKGSAENRRVVIETLRETTGTLNLDNRLVLDGPTLLTFQGIGQVLRGLQATETIDLLLKFIYCSDGYSGNGVGHRPAEDALTSLGVSAVPQLRKSLLDQSDKTGISEARKWTIVRCLANIGGKEAEQALEDAKRSEVDKNMLDQIDAAIATIQRTRRK